MLEDDDMPVYDAPADEGDGAPRQSYNFAPGYHGVVYRADVPDWGAGPRRSEAKVKGTGARDSTKAATTTTTTADDGAGPATNPGSSSSPSSSSSQPTSEEDRLEGDKNDEETHYKLQSMKWGLIPFWTKRNPDYGSMMKTINCRDDSLSQTGGMWASMKGRKRCIVVAQGFYEWLNKGREKVPHFVKRRDGKLMCFAGLWDCVKYEGMAISHDP